MRLICTVGFPRSGKTTWARTQGHPIVNPDSIRLSLHGQRFAVNAEPFVWAIAKVMVRSLFLSGHETVIVDATNTTRKRRDEWIDDGWTTLFKVIETPSGECIRRARSVGDTDIIPIIEKMAAQCELLSPEETTII